MQIHCPNCNTLVPAVQINIQDKLAVCPNCNSVFSFEKDLVRKTKERKVKQPKGLTVTENDDALEIQFRWLRIWHAAEYILVVLYGLVAVFPAIGAVAAFNSGPSIVMALVGGGLAALSLYILYWFLVALIDHLHITADNTTLSAKYEPLPKGGMPQIAINEIERVYVHRPENDIPQSDRDRRHCFVQVVCRDGREVTLASLRYEVALFVAQTIDSFLHDDPVTAPAVEEAETDVELLAESQTQQSMSMRG